MTNQDLESCKRDIEIIRSTIERSKVNLGSMALLFIIYGATVLISNLFCPPATMYLDILRSVFPWIRYAVLTASLVFFFFLYRNSRAANNIHTLLLLRIWGITMFGIPLITLVKNILLLILNEDILYRAQPIVLVLVHLLEIYAFVFSLMFTGMFLENKLMTILALVLLPIPFLALMSQAGGVALTDGVYIASYFASKLHVCYNAVSCAYMAIGIYFIVNKITKKRNSQQVIHGNK
ncbi:MAG: hypothetical protein E7645_08675 [Ruminococcaceae bacterium]|nr:hypothetical protein [Oscillospiraceae bacterium]